MASALWCFTKQASLPAERQMKPGNQYSEINEKSLDILSWLQPEVIHGNTKAMKYLWLQTSTIARRNRV